MTIVIFQSPELRLQTVVVLPDQQSKIEIFIFVYSDLKQRTTANPHRSWTQSVLKTHTHTV